MHAWCACHLSMLWQGFVAFPKMTIHGDAALWKENKQTEDGQRVSRQREQREWTNKTEWWVSQKFPQVHISASFPDHTNQKTEYDTVYQSHCFKKNGAVLCYAFFFKEIELIQLLGKWFGKVTRLYFTVMNPGQGSPLNSIFCGFMTPVEFLILQRHSGRLLYVCCQKSWLMFFFKRNKSFMTLKSYCNVFIFHFSKIKARPMSDRLNR